MTRQRLDPRALRLHQVVHGIFTLGLLGAALVTTNVAAMMGRGWLWAALWLVVSLAIAFVIWRLGHRWAQVSYEHTSWMVSLDGLEISRGVFWRRTITVPRSRIQHTDVVQGPLQRGYGLATLVLFTAGAEHARIALDGLAFETALALREDLLRTSDGAGA